MSSTRKADGFSLYYGAVRVARTEERGADVNMASHLLWDAYRGEFEVAALVTNDSDLLEAVRIVKDELRLKVGILAPTLRPGRSPSCVLRLNATFLKPVREGVLAASQFPEVLHDLHGPI